MSAYPHHDVRRAEADRSIAPLAARAGIFLTLAQIGVLADLLDQNIVRDTLEKIGTAGEHPSYVQIETEIRKAHKATSHRERNAEKDRRHAFWWNE